jgi:acyl-CoA thioesterase-1
MREQLGTTARLSRLVLRILLGATALVLLHGTEGVAQSVRIVALGASNTAGWGVGKGGAWPARLESLLKAKGIAVTVNNAGISGNSSRDMLARLDSAVPTGVQLVILHANGFNDRRKGQQGEFAANVAQINARLAARKIRVLRLQGDLYGLIRSNPLPDGIHLTPEGHAKLAARVLPQVLAALGR